MKRNEVSESPAKYFSTFNQIGGNRMQHWRKVLSLAFLGCFIAGSAFATTKLSMDVMNEKNKEINVKCINCHLKENNSLVQQWRNSPHAAGKDGSIGCYNCHAADKDDILGYTHEGAFIKSIQTPKDCGYCHEREVKEQQNSHHAAAGQIMASLDNVVGEVICSMEDKADAVNGCWQCHGSELKPQMGADGKTLKNEYGAVMLDPSTYPNSGVGRLNPDGTKGACNACHGKHSFRASTARQPENCGKCHLGPDHPQMEIYNESKHGIAYNSASRAHGMNGMNIMKAGKWVLGKDYYTAPTCATCHIGSYQKSDGSVVQNTHNVGDRISWTLRPKVSAKLNRVIFADGTQKDIPGDIPPQAGSEIKYKEFKHVDGAWKKVPVEKEAVEVVSWEDRRNNMKGVCKQCHGEQKVSSFYKQFDSLVVTYNEKFAKPTKKLYGMAMKDGLIHGSTFHTELGWHWWELWHHEGRRARHGAAMQGPDYTHWHGMYDVAHNFYFKFIPELMHLAEQKGMTEKYEKEVGAILARPEHAWYKEGFDADLMKDIKAEEKDRYKQ
jgi:hydroxylamine dehydrogenase